jgi:hypothetical protein
MSIADRDRRLRMIPRVAHAIAAAPGKRAEGRLDEALALLELAGAEIFGTRSAPCCPRWGRRGSAPSRRAPR